MTSKDVPVVPVIPATTTTQLPSPVIRITYVDVAFVSSSRSLYDEKKKSAPRRTTQSDHTQECCRDVQLQIENSFERCSYAYGKYRVQSKTVFSRDNSNSKSESHRIIVRVGENGLYGL